MGNFPLISSSSLIRTPSPSNQRRFLSTPHLPDDVLASSIACIISISSPLRQRNMAHTSVGNGDDTDKVYKIFKVRGYNHINIFKFTNFY